MTTARATNIRGVEGRETVSRLYADQQDRGRRDHYRAELDRRVEAIAVPWPDLGGVSDNATGG